MIVPVLECIYAGLRVYCPYVFNCTINKPWGLPVPYIIKILKGTVQGDFIDTSILIGLGLNEEKNYLSVF